MNISACKKSKVGSVIQIKGKNFSITLRIRPWGIICISSPTFWKSGIYAAKEKQEARGPHCSPDKYFLAKIIIIQAGWLKVAIIPLDEGFAFYLNNEYPSQKNALQIAPSLPLSNLFKMKISIALHFCNKEKKETDQFI